MLDCYLKEFQVHVHLFVLEHVRQVIFGRFCFLSLKIVCICGSVFYKDGLETVHNVFILMVKECFNAGRVHNADTVH